MGVFPLPALGNDRRLDVPHFQLPRRLEQALTECLAVFRAVAVEQRVRVGNDLLGRDAEQVLRAVADIGVANIPVRSHLALIDHPGDARRQRTKALVRGHQCLARAVMLDRETHQARQGPHDPIGFRMFRRLRLEVQRQHADRCTRQVENRMRVHCLQPVRAAKLAQQARYLLRVTGQVREPDVASGHGADCFRRSHVGDVAVADANGEVVRQVRCGNIGKTLAAGVQYLQRAERAGEDAFGECRHAVKRV